MAKKSRVKFEDGALHISAESMAKFDEILDQVKTEDRGLSEDDQVQEAALRNASRLIEEHARDLGIPFGPDLNAADLLTAFRRWEAARDNKK
ncbi:hypothetical protein ACFL17_06270 [Pseudomonadota bacterium]